MAELIRLQLDIKSKLERAVKNYKKSPKERLTIQYIQTRLEYLEEQWKTFNCTHNQIVQSSDQEIKNYIESEIFELAEDLYIDYKSELKVALCKCTPVSNVVNTSNNSKVSNSIVKLPKINIPTFSGKYSEWPTFRDLFVSLIHSNNSLDNVQKLHYLKGYLAGEAEQLLRQIPVSSDNYDRSWYLLHERYNNKKYLSHCIITKLLSQRNIVTENAAGLKDLMDTTTDCLDALNNLGIDVSTWDILIIHLLSLKLDAETKKHWEFYVTSTVDSNGLPTFDQFKLFITNRYRALEFVEPTKQIHSNFKYNNPGNKKSFHVSHVTCSYCDGSHKICHCRDFVGCNVDARRDFVQQKRLCFNCLGFNHSARECTVSTHCRICNKLHHTLLHPKGPPRSWNTPGNTEAISANVAGQEEGSSDVMNGVTTDAAEAEVGNFLTSCLSAGKVLAQVLLATAVVNVETKRGERQLVRALLDQGSQASFVTESTVQLLGLKKIPSKGLISGLGGDKNVLSKSIVIVNLHSRIDPKIKITVKAYVLNTITAFLPAKKVVELNGLDLSGLALADPEYHTPSKIDMLLGSDVYGLVLQEGIRKDRFGGAIAQSTTLGWILSGTVGNNLTSSHVANNIVLHSTIEENDILKRFWEMEEEPMGRHQKIWDEEEAQCERLYKETTLRDEEGRYVVKIPFKVDKPRVEGSLEIAQKRFDMLERRLNKNEEFKVKFTEVMNDYLSSGHMERVDKGEVHNPDAVYVPILAVIREDKDTTQVRVVCDSSCKGKDGISINDLMMKGPILQQELRHLLMRWRMHFCCMVADIAKMYRQIKVTKLDTDYQRLLWRPDAQAAVQVYRMLRVSFGSASAPYLAVRTLQQVAHDNGKQYPLAYERVLNDFYIDDYMTGCDTVEEAVTIYRETNELLQKGGFTLRKWTSNKEEVLQEINKQLHEKGDRLKEHENLQIKLDSVIKILGLTWDRREDQFKYSVDVTPISEPVTKRKILSEVARLFDPLGWLSPCIILGKILIQKLWLKGLDWDEPVSTDIYKQWVTYRKELPLLIEFKIPRWVGTRTNYHMELHGFSDASNVAYAAVIYARVKDTEGNITVHLVTAKTKVSPVKIVSIPRLELCGAVLLTKLLVEVSEVLTVDRQNIFAWTDSTVVLAWINSHPRKWKPFVANRVSEILTATDPSQWAHVKSKQNPADTASRGMCPSELLKCDMWKAGPDFLKSQDITRNKVKDLTTDIEEIRVHMVIEESNIWERFSSLNRLIRVITYCTRFIYLTRTNKENRKKFTYLTSEELTNTTHLLIQRCQSEHFKEEIRDLKLNRDVRKGSKLVSLNPFIDKNKLLRAGGRLGHSCLSIDSKHPIVLPKDATLTKLLLEDAHYKTLHGGQQLMLSYVRKKYWVIGVKVLIKGIIHKCVKCIRHSKVSRNQLMGQLPEARVVPSKVFSHSGVDFAGPINVRYSKGRGRHAYKGYICLFICMATRAVHLEVVSDMTTQGFLAAFKRFVARRGRCSHMYSDNGRNFLGASKELQDMFNCEKSGILPDIQEALANNNTTWHFIPPYSPNFGGLWEAGIKSTKYHLKRVIGESTLTFEELSTVLAQIEACLNSRPLSRIDTEGDTCTVLTPGHFIVGESMVAVPDQAYEQCNLNGLTRWQLTQRMVQSFWSKWSSEYLHQFLQRHKWSKQLAEPQIGDVVLVKELDLPPARWLIGRITSKHPGADAITRVVTLQTKNGVFKRPVSKLSVLPTNA